MPRKFFRRHLPSHDSVRRHRFLGRFRAFLHHHNLWHLNRHSVAGGFAVGLFAGLVPGPFQMLCAAILAIAFKVNLPVALVTTLYTNPLTIGPLYLIAYEIGRLFVGSSGAVTDAPALDWQRFGEWLEAFAHWTLSLGKPLAVGLVVLAVSLAVLGYLFAQAAWRAYVILSWRKRRRRRVRPQSETRRPR